MSEQTYKVKEYPLEIESGDGALWSKGWQPARDFVEAAERWDGEPRDESVVRYEVWKFVPSNPYDDFGGYYWVSSLGKPGAFPVTVIDV